MPTQASAVTMALFFHLVLVLTLLIVLLFLLLVLFFTVGMLESPIANVQRLFGALWSTLQGLSLSPFVFCSFLLIVSISLCPFILAVSRV